jgi:hypothetical protein
VPLTSFAEEALAEEPVPSDESDDELELPVPIDEELLEVSLEVDPVPEVVPEVEVSLEVEPVPCDDVELSLDAVPLAPTAGSAVELVFDFPPPA